MAGGARLAVMLGKTTAALLTLCALAAPALAADRYPVFGQWGQSASSEKGAIDCGNTRVIDFKGDQRTDSNGGVPAYRIKSITAEGPSRYHVVDEFTTGQISNGSASYTLQQIDDDHIEINLQQGGMLKLQRCK
jgi:hypothetical protein